MEDAGLADSLAQFKYLVGEVIAAEEILRATGVHELLRPELHSEAATFALGPLAKIALARGDHVEAERCARLSLDEQRGDRYDGLWVLAALGLYEGDIDGAAAYMAEL